MNKSDFTIFKNHPNLVYLDNSATTQKPAQVIDRINKFYNFENANVGRGLYPLSMTATDEYEKARKIIAKFINADDREIIFTSGTTDSINKIANMVAPLVFLNENQDETIMATEVEHHSNLLPWQQLAKKHNKRFILAKILKNYSIDKKHLHSLFKKHNVKIFAITHISNVTGTINPIKELVSFIRKNSPQTLIILDAAQSIAHIPVDVKNLDVDFLAFSGHKIYGPTGIGVLFMKKYLQKILNPTVFGGGMINKVEKQSSTFKISPEKFEAGTPNIAGAIGLASAIEYVLNIGFKQIQAHENELTTYFLEKAKDLDDLIIYGSLKPDINKRAGIFSFNYKNIHSHDLTDILGNNNIAMRAGHHCAQILVREVLNVSSTTRVSFGIYNDKSDIDLFFKELSKVSNQLQ